MIGSSQFMKLEKKIIIDGIIELKTGLHIGGTETGYEIGTIDSPVIRDGFGRIYIPGSSIKGKMRSLLERSEFNLDIIKRIWETEKEANNIKKRLKTQKNLSEQEKEKEKGKLKKIDYELKKLLDEAKNEGWKKVGNSWIHECDRPDCLICKYFGRSGDTTNVSPTRIHVYDAYLMDYLDDNDDFKDLGEIEFETEIKGENTIDRVTSIATPRFFERVPAGSRFKFRIVVDLYTNDNLEDLRKTLLKAMKLLEDDYLGGSGSRGYGRIKFKELTVKIKEIKDNDYEKIGKEKKTTSIDGLYTAIQEILENKNMVV